MAIISLENNVKITTFRPPSGFLPPLWVLPIPARVKDARNYAAAKASAAAWRSRRRV